MLPLKNWLECRYGDSPRSPTSAPVASSALPASASQSPSNTHRKLQITQLHRSQPFSVLQLPLLQYISIILVSSPVHKGIVSVLVWI